MATYSITPYSEKSIVVRTNPPELTRPIASNLTAIGGKWNTRLRGGPGWIFSKTRESAVRELLTGVTGTYPSQDVLPLTALFTAIANNDLPGATTAIDRGINVRENFPNLVMTVANRFGTGPEAKPFYDLFMNNYNSADSGRMSPVSHRPVPMPSPRLVHPLPYSFTNLQEDITALLSTATTVPTRLATVLTQNANNDFYKYFDPLIRTVVNNPFIGAAANLTSAAKIERKEQIITDIITYDIGYNWIPLIREAIAANRWKLLKVLLVTNDVLRTPENFEQAGVTDEIFKVIEAA